MHILIITHYYPPEIGAPQRRWDAFVRYWRQAGVDITVVTPLPHYPTGRLVPGSSRHTFRARIGLHGERIIRVPFVPGATSAIRKLADQMLAAMASLPAAVGRSFDLVLSTAPGLPSLLAGAAVARIRNVPHVVEMRDAWPDLMSQAGLGRGPTLSFLTSLVTHVQNRADLVATVSQDFARVLQARLPNTRVIAIPNGIDVSDVPPLSSSPLSRRPLQVLYLGTVGVSQALESVVKAAADAGSEVVQLRVVGGGAAEVAVKRTAAHLRVPATFDGQVSGDALWDAYAKADTVVVPLRNWPAFQYTVPSKLYEIFATGKHVSGALSGEGARLITDARAGFAVPPEMPGLLAAEWRMMQETGEHKGWTANASREWVSKHANYNALATSYLSELDRVVRERRT